MIILHSLEGYSFRATINHFLFFTLTRAQSIDWFLDKIIIGNFMTERIQAHKVLQERLFVQCGSMLYNPAKLESLNRFDSPII